MTSTNAGKAEIAGLIIGSGVAFDSMALGTGTTSFAATSTQLNNEYVRASATLTNTTTDTAGDTAQFVHEFTFTETLAITEVGIFNHASTGDLLAGATFAAINVVNTDAIEMTVNIDLD